MARTVLALVPGVLYHATQRRNRCQGTDTGVGLNEAQDTWAAFVKPGVGIDWKLHGKGIMQVP